MLLHPGAEHVPEIQQQSGLTEKPTFVPAYGAFRQGIVLTIPLQLRLLAPGVNGSRLHDCLTQHYRDTNHVQVLSMQTAKELTYLDPQALTMAARISGAPLPRSNC